MSASRERRKRQALAEVGQSPKQLKAAEQKKQKKKRAIRSIIAIVLVLAVGIGCLYGLVIRPNAMPRKTIALRTGEHDLSAVQFGYYYYDAINSFYQNYGSYINYVMSDPSMPIDQQIYDEETGKTWADYFMESAAESAKYDYAAYDAAVAAGYTLSAEGEQSIQDSLNDLEEHVKEDGYKSLNAYFSEVYGKGSSKASYIEYQRLHMTASEYAQKVDAERVYTDEQIQAKDDENPAVYSNVTYRSYYLSASNFLPEDDASEDDEETEEDTEAEEAKKAEALEQARKAAQEMADASEKNEGKFIEMAMELATESAKQTYENPDATLHTGDTYDDVNALLKDWLYDDARQEGDVSTFADGDSGYYVVYYLSTDDNNYNTVNVRHILIAPEADEDSDEDGANDAVSDAADASAKAEAEQILADWKAGEATEDSFAALATEKSSDSPEGGLYENVYHGRMVEEFNDWCFDPARKTGDTDIVKTTYGYHIMYFIGQGDNYRRTQIVSDLKQADYDEWINGLIEGKDAEIDEAGTKYLHTDLVLSAQ